MNTCSQNMIAAQSGDASRGPAIPFRYAQAPKNNVTGQDLFYMCPFLNIYTLPGGHIRSGQDARQILSSLLGDDLPALLPPDASLSDCIRILSYGIGFFSAGDLTYYLGIDGTFMRSFLAATEKSYHNLVRYKSSKNYNTYHYYLYKPASFPFIGWERKYPSPVSYAGKVISPRSIPHGYSASLSILMMGLWGLRNPACYFECHPEISLGNYRDAATKRSAEITMDALCILRDRRRREPRALICLEQDMGTENYSTLLAKLYDYAQTSYFDDKAAEGIYILFSCNRLIAAKPGRPALGKKWHVALYAVFRQLLSLQHRESDVLDGDMYSVLPSLDKYLENLYRRGKASAIETIHEFGVFPELKEDSLFGVPLKEIDQCILSLAGRIPDLFSQFLAAIGLDLPDDRDVPGRSIPFAHGRPLPLRIFQRFLNAYPQDTDYLARVSYNRTLYGIALSRHHGLAHAILSVMLLKRRIHAQMNTVNQENNAIFLHPIYQGYSIYTVATPLLSNYMPYLLWDRASREISCLESCISAYLPSGISPLTYSALSPQADIGRGGLSFSSIQDGAYFPNGRFRHYYHAFLSSTDGALATYRFCVEDLDADTGAYCRAYLFLRYYCSPDTLHLIMLVDSPDSALAFYQSVVWGRKLGVFSQSPRCRVPLYAIDTYREHSLSWDMPRLLFLERGNSLYADRRLFGISENGSVIYFR